MKILVNAFLNREEVKIKGADIEVGDYYQGKQIVSVKTFKNEDGEITQKNCQLSDSDDWHGFAANDDVVVDRPNDI